VPLDTFPLFRQTQVRNFVAGLIRSVSWFSGSGGELMAKQAAAVPTYLIEQLITASNAER
jgi:hypothetical protein